MLPKGVANDGRQQVGRGGGSGGGRKGGREVDVAFFLFFRRVEQLF